MQAYMSDYDNIAPEWLKCETRIESYLSERYPNRHFISSCCLNSTERPSALNSINLKFYQPAPQILADGGWHNDDRWRWNRDSIDTVSLICKRAAEEFGFQFLGIETEQVTGKPLFVIKVGE